MNSLQTFRLYDCSLKKLEEFEKWAKGNPRIGPIYPVDYCPECKDIKVAYHYSPDAGDDWCSPSMKRYRTRFEPCGHIINSEREHKPICDLSPDLRKKCREMEQLEFQFKIFKEKLKDIERVRIEHFKAEMSVLQVIKNRAKKIKFKKK